MADAGQDTFGKMFKDAVQIYWKGAFVIIWPLILLPVFLVQNVPSFRCLWVVCTMAGLWITEALPLAVTALIPVVAFPLMSILPSDPTCECYMKETNMMFIGGLIIAIAVEYCNLHRRLALSIIRVIGCSPRRLHIGLCICTCFVSMWISNTAATAMMCPIVEATLVELEMENIVPRFEGNVNSLAEDFDLSTAVPTRHTMCQYLSIAYSAGVGGLGTLIGTGTNLTLKGNYESRFPDSPEGISFTHWLFIGIPLMIVLEVLMVVWMQVLFLGLFRPWSGDSKAISIGKEGEEVAKKAVKDKVTELGPMSFHELGVAFCFVLAILLWFFRRPQFIKGWPEYMTDFKAKDSVCAVIVALILYSVPAQPHFIYALKKDSAKRSSVRSSPLLTWKVTQQKMHWGLMLLLGGGFALAEGSKASGMDSLIGDELAMLTSMPRYSVLTIVLCCTVVITQIFTSNVAVASLILPILSAMSVTARWHPLYLMMPATLATSFAYMLPIATPPNALAAAPCNCPTKHMMIAGFGAAIISLACLLVIWPLLSGLVYGLDEFPWWADNTTTTKDPNYFISLTPMTGFTLE